MASSQNDRARALEKLRSLRNKLDRTISLLERLDEAAGFDEQLDVLTSFREVLHDIRGLQALAADATPRPGRRWT